MEVAWNRNTKNSWSNSGSGKESTLETSLKQRDGIGLESALATQLQQAWLQTQLPKRNVPRTDFLSPLPSPDYQNQDSPDPFQQHLQRLQYAPAASRSSSFSPQSPTSILSHPSPQYSNDALSEAYSSSDGGSADDSGRQDDSGGVELEPMEEDMMLQYLADMMEDEEMADKKCMYVQCSAYQAMTKELADLIGDGNPTDGNVYGNPYDAPNTSYEDVEKANKDTGGTNWIDEVLNSSPHDFFPEEQFGVSRSGVGLDLTDEVSSIASGITNISTGSPKSRSTDSIPKEAITAPAPLPTPLAAPVVNKSNSIMACPYLDNDRPENAVVDYTNGRSGIESLADLFPLLMQCAQAVAHDNVGEAHQLINLLRLKISLSGDGGQRMAYYVVEALVARLSGTGGRLYTALNGNLPSAAEMLKAYRLFVQCNPLPKIAHFFANATILKAVQGSSRIHVIDYGILYGIQWPCLLKKLSMREGGPPHVRITGIDFAMPGFQKNDRVEETGKRLKAKAKEIGVELEYHAIAGKWENITAAQLQLRDDETLVVNCMFRLRNLLDETVMASSPRKMVLSRIHSLNPKVFTMGVCSAQYNSPFFMARFRETMNHFSALFDAIHTTVPPDSEMRQMAEREILGRQILNVIACEGTERIERAETHRNWQSRSVNAGLKQLPLDPAITARAHELLRTFNRYYGVAVDGNWLLTGWRDTVLHGLSAWTSA